MSVEPDKPMDATRRLKRSLAWKLTDWDLVVEIAARLEIAPRCINQDAGTHSDAIGAERFQA